MICLINLISIFIRKINFIFKYFILFWLNKLFIELILSFKSFIIFSFVSFLTFNLLFKLFKVFFSDSIDSNLIEAFDNSLEYCFIKSTNSFVLFSINFFSSSNDFIFNSYSTIFFLLSLSFLDNCKSLFFNWDLLYYFFL